MPIEKKFVTAEEQASLTMADAHALEYLRSGGTRGHIWDFTPVGGYPWATCLLLETFGAKSGERRLAPLLYAPMDGGFVIVASKGGAPNHPGWYHNIRAAKEITIQIATQAFNCAWSEPEGSDRTRIWGNMVDLYPPYADYQKGTDRTIPLVLFKPLREVAPFRE
jgi:deazaflavin-dependent oxidoreductase (nitroreductase family)